MNQPLRIGLLMIGGRSWIGGAEYIKNIIFALSSLPHEVRSNFELCLLFDGKYAELEIQEQLKNNLEYYYNLDSELEPYTFINRLKWKIIRTIQPHPEPRLSLFLNKANIDFIYPFLTPNKANLSYRGFPWIFDFQHKYMPHLFSDSEIKYRDSYFTQISELTVLLHKVRFKSTNSGECPAAATLALVLHWGHHTEVSPVPMSRHILQWEF